jgi:hypothetical protein
MNIDDLILVSVEGPSHLTAHMSRIAEANWHMLTKGEPFAPAGPAHCALVA